MNVAILAVIRFASRERPRNPIIAISASNYPSPKYELDFGNPYQTK